MNNKDEDDNAYVFHLDALKNGYIYYRTYSVWANKFGYNGRDMRKPDYVNVPVFCEGMNSLGQNYKWMRNEDDLNKWAEDFGWIISPIAFIKEYLEPFIETKECVKSAIGLFFDINLPRKRARSRRVTKKLRQIVLERDGHKCVQCQRGESDGMKLTMDHVIPFTRGGETTEGNLVTLCESCNNGYGNKEHGHLFALADLQNGWDPSLIKAEFNRSAFKHAFDLSDNMMVSRCKISQIHIVAQKVFERFQK